MKVACDDRLEARTKDHKELVAVTERHVEHAHLKMVSESEILQLSEHP